MGEATFRIPAAAWKHGFDEPLDQVKGPNTRPGFGSLVKMLPMIIRLANYARKRRANGFDPINLDPNQRLEPYQGVPLGGIGCGSIGRGWRGDFRRWQLRSGYLQPKPVWADQFSLFVQPEGSPGTARVLFPGRPDDGTLAAWNWELPAEGHQYHGLFPRAWTTYHQPLPGVDVTCRQLSPVIAQNYVETSLPVTEFRWLVQNTGPRPVTLGLMFTFQNGDGGPNDRQGGHYNQAISQLTEVGPLTGIRLHHAYRQEEVLDPDQPGQRRPKLYRDPLSFAVMARTEPDAEVTRCTRFVCSGDGADLWDDFATDGRLDNTLDEHPAAHGETIGAALAATMMLRPGERREVAFSLAWDMPHYRPGSGRFYQRRYTRFYGSDGGAAVPMAVDALLRAGEWEKQIETWQRPYITAESVPLWYRTALINELYYLVDGGTLWAYPEEGEPPDPEMGRFAYLEGLEYRMYNTYDVHFYASFALIQLWPRLELALQRDMAAATLAESPDWFTELYSGKRVPRKLYGAVPHDVGWPDEDPWYRLNGYFMHNVNDWKDLNPKLVLQIYRDFQATGDRQFVQDTWPAVAAAVERISGCDRDGDGLIENDGFPDQTYDVWSVQGPSAYTGGLWLASLGAAACLANEVGQPDRAGYFMQLLDRAKRAYTERLWNGRYFNYDSSDSRQHDSVMADQLCGHWYARACGLPEIITPAQARSALETIYALNVKQFHHGHGQMGAVNGMRPDGSVDQTSMQSQEVWAGTTYALAAAMLQEGLTEAAFSTAWGVYHTTYENSGFWFQTPEAWDGRGFCRAVAYMRPLAIWAMQWAIERSDP